MRQNGTVRQMNYPLLVNFICPRIKKGSPSPLDTLLTTPLITSEHAEFEKFVMIVCHRSPPPFNILSTIFPSDLCLKKNYDDYTPGTKIPFVLLYLLCSLNLPLDSPSQITKTERIKMRSMGLQTVSYTYSFN